MMDEIEGRRGKSAGQPYHRNAGKYDFRPKTLPNASSARSTRMPCLVRFLLVSPKRSEPKTTALALLRPPKSHFSPLKEGDQESSLNNAQTTSAG